MEMRKITVAVLVVFEFGSRISRSLLFKQWD